MLRRKNASSRRKHGSTQFRHIQATDSATSVKIPKHDRGLTMRKILITIIFLVAGCTATEEEVLTTSVDVNQSELSALLGDIDALADNALPVDTMLELAISTPIDEEQQDRFAISFKGSDEEILFHVWREQVDWIHVYFSSTSKELIAALEDTNKVYAREDDT